MDAIAEPLRPWKLATLAVGIGLLVVGAFYYVAPDWDIPICFIMALMAYLTASKSMHVIVQPRFSISPIFQWKPVTIPRQSRGPSLMGRSKRLIEHQGSRDYSYCFSSPQTARPRRSQPPNAKHEIPNRRLTRLFATSHIHRSRGTCSALPSGKSRPIPVKVKLLLPPRQSRGISFVGLAVIAPGSEVVSRIASD